MPWLRDELPILQKCLYADTAASGLLSKGLLNWRQEHDLAHHNGGSVAKLGSFNLLGETKTALGGLMGCHPSLIALTPNFSLGFNLLLNGLPPGKKVLLVNEDYPSVNWPFESRKFKLHYVACDEQLEDHIRKKIRDKGIEILALSLVQWVNGIKIRPGFLFGLKKEFPDLLVLADGTQFCGAFGLDFGSSGIDVLGASGYKWMLGGFGNAFFLFSERAERHFNLSSTGYAAANGNPQGSRDIKFPRQLEPGHLDPLNFGSLWYSVNRLQGIGMAAIEAHNRELSSHFARGLQELGLLSPVVAARKEYSTIFNIKGDDSLYHRLGQNKIICSRRGGGIRLGFHLYNNLGEVDAIVGLLKKSRIT